MADFWNTKNKRIMAMVAMFITGYTGLSMVYTNLWQLPAFVYTPFVGKISIGLIASAFTLLSVWLLADNQLNG